MKKVKLIIIGAGNRGTGYATYAQEHPDQAEVVGISEPRDFYRNRMAEQHNIPSENVYTDWREMLKRKKFADAAIVATQDKMHCEPMLACARKKYDILQEKPMATNEEDCIKMVRAALDNKIIFAVCHVMRYTRYTKKLKSLVDSGLIGEVISIQHLEPVGYWHMAHSFVRGNWRNLEESSPMLLAKSCHDLDWIRHIMGVPCKNLTSFGSLVHFQPENAPEGAGERCVDCKIESDCAYSARKIYLEKVKMDHKGWPIDVITTDRTEKGVLEAITSGPYGRCVYRCDNDVVDNQVVNMEFEGGKTASFTMTGFTEMTGRKSTIFGTKGQIIGNDDKIILYDFLTDKTTTYETKVEDSSILGGHGGGDYQLMKHFISAVANQDPSMILSGPEETLETHRMVFAAERARLNNSVVSLNGKL
jgi:predicted dehydrogenase